MLYETVAGGELGEGVGEIVNTGYDHLNNIAEGFLVEPVIARFVNEMLSLRVFRYGI